MLFALTTAIALAGLLLAQSVSFDGRPAAVLQNDKIELTVLTQGGTLANLTLRKDAEKLSPFWNTDRAQGRAPVRATGALGHFLCLDGFGTPSDEEKAAGWPTHGEASKQEWETVQYGPATLKLSNCKKITVAIKPFPV